MSVRVLFPITDGLVVAALKAGFAGAALPYSSGVTVVGKLPATRTQRMVTVRNDSGPDDQTQTRRRYGVNVWAESAVNAEKLALLAMAILRVMPDGKPVTLIDDMTGPFEIEDDPKMTVGNINLAHYYFTFRLTARGASF